MSQRRPPAPGSGLARVRESLEASARAKLDTLELSGARIAEAGQLLVERLRAGGRVLACGNGGSAADAQHLAAELAGRFDRERPALPALALTANSSDLTAIGNDYGFERVFARLVEAHGRPGDVLVAISTSGNSRNVLAAVECARSAGLATIALVGTALVLAGVNAQPLEVMEQSGFVEALGRENMTPGLDAALTRARELC